VAQTAAHLVDHVIPQVPVRHWVLSLPILLRLRLAAQPKLVTPVPQVVQRVITRHLLGQAGLKADEAGSGAVTARQREQVAQPHTRLEVASLPRGGHRARELLRAFSPCHPAAAHCHASCSRPSRLSGYFQVEPGVNLQVRFACSAVTDGGRRRLAGSGRRRYSLSRNE
jgi:hypothetical protein